MNSIFSEDVEASLIDVDNLLEKSLLPWWDDITSYKEHLQEDITWKVLPEVVLDVYKYFGIDRQLSIAMANIFKTIYFSNHIHSLVKDDEEGQKHSNDLQFTILIGDYIFGRVLKLLVENGVSELLAVLSNMICELNEGMVLQYKTDVKLHQALQKTRAPLYAAAFDTAAQLSGLEGEHKQLYQEIGYNLGMAIELSNENESGPEAKTYIHNAELILRHCHDFYNMQDNILEKIIKDLHVSICGVHNVAVV